MYIPTGVTTIDVEKFLNFIMGCGGVCNINNARACGNPNEKKLLDPKKIMAFVSWGLVTEQAGFLRITERGKCLASSNDKQSNAIYRDVVRDNDAYYDVFLWVNNDPEKDFITSKEVAEFWKKTTKYEMHNESENIILDRAVCLFKLSVAAGLGNLYLGRRGKPTRLELNKASIGELIDNGNQNSVMKVDNTVIHDKEKLNTPIIHITETNQEGKEMVPLTISFVDGRKAVLNMPKDASKEDAQYVFDMLQLMLKRQYSLD